MKKKVLMVLLAATLSVSMIAGCGSKGDNNTDTTKTESKQDSDQEAADKVAKLIDDIYVQERTDKTDEQCTAAKEAWDLSLIHISEPARRSTMWIRHCREL